MDNNYRDQTTGPGGREPAGPHTGGRGPRRAARWGIGLSAVSVLAAGAVAFVMFAGSPGSSGNASLAAAMSPASTGSSSPASPGATPAHGASSGHRARQRRRAALRRLLRRTLHGQVTFQGRHGTRTVAFERGTITSAGSGTVTVAARDGVTWTWHLTSATVVRHSGSKVSAGQLTQGDRVGIAGPVVSGSDRARVIRIRPAAGSHHSSA